MTLQVIAAPVASFPAAGDAEYFLDAEEAGPFDVEVGEQPTE